MNVLKKFFPFIFLFTVSVLAIYPFFHSGFFPIHDDTQVQRVFEMKTALKDGMFPVRWVPDLGYGYGYPIFNFYAPLPYYIGGFINLLGGKTANLKKKKKKFFLFIFFIFFYYFFLSVYFVSV